MRFARLAAFALWLVVALLAVAGFAAFSPQTAPTTTSTTIGAGGSATADWGSASGRVVAQVFTSGLRATPNQAAEDRLLHETVVSHPPSTIPTTTTPTGEANPNPSPRPTTTTTAAPPSPSTTATTPRGWLSETEARTIIALFFAPEDVDLAVRVSYCESRWDPGATNRSSGAAGLFQQIPRFWAERATAAGWAGADIYDAEANTAVSAWLVYDGGGWTHWAASQACWG